MLDDGDEEVTEAEYEPYSASNNSRDATFEMPKLRIFPARDGSDEEGRKDCRVDQARRVCCGEGKGECRRRASM